MSAQCPNHDGNCRTCREERERVSDEQEEDRIVGGVLAQTGGDSALLDFYDANPGVASFALGSLRSPGSWVWHDTGHVAHLAVDLRDALRNARSNRAP